MNKFSLLVIFLAVSATSCKSTLDTSNPKTKDVNAKKTKFKIAVGSCNRQDLPQDYWAVIQKDSADVFVWGGDNIYGDTSDMKAMDSMYTVQKNNNQYQSFVESLPNPILGVWDDHDYGINDGGKEWEYKDESKVLFLNFLDIDSTHAMAKREGTYYSETIKVEDKSIKFYMLDSRYFRDGLIDAEDPDKRYQLHKSSDSTMLGEQQWKWLEEEFRTSKADFNVIVSSIQFLSSQHGFESWGNFPYEVHKMEGLIKQFSPKNLIILSGDRHISEFSQKEIEGLEYPLTDFTSSGLTHAYTAYDGEPNRYRVGEVTAQTSYGVVELDLEQNKAELKIKSTEDGRVLQNLMLSF